MPRWPDERGRTVERRGLEADPVLGRNLNPSLQRSTDPEDTVQSFVRCLTNSAEFGVTYVPVVRCTQPIHLAFTVLASLYESASIVGSAVRGAERPEPGYRTPK